MADGTLDGLEDGGPSRDATGEERCDYCGATALSWRKCKLVCGSCGNIVKSCADL
jgi:hypothetical protein